MSIAISHNMDNVDPIKDADLITYMGLTAVANAGGTDASGSKFMAVDATAGSNKICYQYTRGGLTLQAVIDVAAQKVTWEIDGLGTVTTTNGTTTDTRYKALCEGLKLPVDTTTGLRCGSCTFKTPDYTPAT